ncbi:hypothetical protein Q9L58_000451 [Maublancomyces gigas]|uniref:Uncharacterized protein n=1 Tax=Discina gigas TaxID=1032678 RepID=A0ABR3GXF4_9PEZI
MQEESQATGRLLVVIVVPRGRVNNVILIHFRPQPLNNNIPARWATEPLPLSISARTPGSWCVAIIVPSTTASSTSTATSTTSTPFSSTPPTRSVA